MVLSRFHPKFLLMLRLLIGGSLALLCCFQLARGQCPFNHSPWGALFLDQPRQLTQAENVYPGEYVEVNLVAGQCYRVVVIDTFGRAMQLVLTDSLTRPLARAEGPPGQALQMSLQPEADAAFFLGLSRADCGRDWQPALLLLEWTAPGTACPQATQPDERE